MKKRSAILQRWFDVIVETYPVDTSSFLKSQQDRFANPVGAAISQGIEGIFDEILHQGMDTEKVSAFLDNIIRIRAVQDFSPSDALAFIFLLKKVVREEIKKELHESHIADELLTFESNIDDLALLSFDIYMKCREKVYEIKANEAKNGTFRLLQRANLICDPELNSGQEHEPDSGEGSISCTERKEAAK